MATVCSPFNARLSDEIGSSNADENLDLHRACRIGDLNTIKRAYKRSPDKVNEKDEKLGWTPLYRTVICGHLEATKYLLKNDADVNSPNNLGETPLHQAADNSQYKLAQLLLDYNANANLQQNDGDTPLHHASFRGDIRMIYLLLKANADPNIQNLVFGRSALHYAVDCGHRDAVELMLTHSASIDLKDRQGKTPFDLARSEDIKSLLEEYRACLESDGEGSWKPKNQYEFSPIHVTEFNDSDKENDNSLLASALSHSTSVHALSNMTSSMTPRKGGSARKSKSRIELNISDCSPLKENTSISNGIPLLRLGSDIKLEESNGLTDANVSNSNTSNPNKENLPSAKDDSTTMSDLKASKSPDLRISMVDTDFKYSPDQSEDESDKVEKLNDEEQEQQISVITYSQDGESNVSNLSDDIIHGFAVDEEAVAKDFQSKSGLSEQLRHEVMLDLSGLKGSSKSRKAKNQNKSQLYPSYNQWQTKESQKQGQAAHHKSFDLTLGSSSKSIEFYNSQNRSNIEFKNVSQNVSALTHDSSDLEFPVTLSEKELFSSQTEMAKVNEKIQEISEINDKLSLIMQSSSANTSKAEENIKLISMKDLKEHVNLNFDGDVSGLSALSIGAQKSQQFVDDDDEGEILEVKEDVKVVVDDEEEDQFCQNISSVFVGEVLDETFDEEFQVELSESNPEYYFGNVDFAKSRLAFNLSNFENPSRGGGKVCRSVNNQVLDLSKEQLQELAKRPQKHSQSTTTVDTADTSQQEYSSESRSPNLITPRGITTSDAISKRTLSLKSNLTIEIPVDKYQKSQESNRSVSEREIPTSARCRSGRSRRERSKQPSEERDHSIPAIEENLKPMNSGRASARNSSARSSMKTPLFMKGREGNSFFLNSPSPLKTDRNLERNNVSSRDFKSNNLSKLRSSGKKDSCTLADIQEEFKGLNDVKLVSNDLTSPRFQRNIDQRSFTEKSRTQLSARSGIYPWLASINMQIYHSLLTEGDLDDLDYLIQRMHSEKPIKDAELKRLGIKKPGHRARIIVKLEEDAGLIPKKKQFRNTLGVRSSFSKVKKPAPQSRGISCCNLPQTVPSFIRIPTLREWLAEINLEKFEQAFIDAGYDDLELVLCQMNSSTPFSSYILKTQIGIERNSYRNRIIHKLEGDIYKLNEELMTMQRDDNGIILEGEDPNLPACNKCIIF
eukprot:CAMPEP_0115004172 /NCGR_PEP_ID=MMETSP0216-20121206/19042_1 /TAXON_ID=223996 /ORGANISM="Protocruzia adherens, Strain Boccale" /LENGTH=1183 /DNA_ID=CAMNT_0002370105 /DNA_START=316 /DNA_END=3867 /DNA_ORIENTATION=+